MALWNVSFNRAKRFKSSVGTFPLEKRSQVAPLTDETPRALPPNPDPSVGPSWVLGLGGGGRGSGCQHSFHLDLVSLFRAILFLINSEKFSARHFSSTWRRSVSEKLAPNPFQGSFQSNLRGSWPLAGNNFWLKSDWAGIWVQVLLIMGRVFDHCAATEVVYLGQWSHRRTQFIISTFPGSFTKEVFLLLFQKKRLWDNQV